MIMKKIVAEDIKAVKDIYEIKEFDYINITQNEQMDKIMKRWPLIAELEKHKQLMRQE